MGNFTKNYLVGILLGMAMGVTAGAVGGYMVFWVPVMMFIGALAGALLV